MNLHGIKKAVGDYKRANKCDGPHIYLNRNTGEVFMATCGSEIGGLLFNDNAIRWIDFGQAEYMFGGNKMAAVKAVCEYEMRAWEFEKRQKEDEF